MKGIGRRHMSSAARALPAAATSASLDADSSERIFWVKRQGSDRSVPLKTTRDTLVGFLKEEVANKLRLDAPLDLITLQLVAQPEDADGKERLVPLDSADTLDEALAKASAELGRVIAPDSEEKLIIIVDVEPIARAFSQHTVLPRRGARSASTS